MRIRPLLKSYYSTTEVETLTKDFLAELPNLKPAQPVITALTTALQETYELIKEVRGKSNFNSLTRAIIEADEDRDNAFKAFYNIVNASSYRLSDKYRKASLAIKTHLDLFDRGLTRYGYARESAELRLFFKEMEHVKAEIEQINATVWLKELKDAEQRFLKTQKEKLSEEDSRKVIALTHEVKEQAVDQMTVILQTLNGLGMANIEGVAPFSVTLDNVIAEVETPAKARHSRRSNQSKEVSEEEVEA